MYIYICIRWPEQPVQTKRALASAGKQALRPIRRVRLGSFGGSTRAKSHLKGVHVPNTKGRPRISRPRHSYQANSHSVNSHYVKRAQKCMKQPSSKNWTLNMGKYTTITKQATTTNESSVYCVCTNNEVLT